MGRYRIRHGARNKQSFVEATTTHVARRAFEMNGSPTTSHDEC